MRVVTRDEFVTLLQTCGSEKLQQHLPRYDLDVILGAGKCAVHDGNLSQSADWRRTTTNVLVIGSLSCGGLVDIAPEGSSDRGGSLWVLGDLRCRSFAGHYGVSAIIDGEFVVTELAVIAFEHSMLLVTGDFTSHFLYGLDIWAEVGGHAAMEYGHGYALPLAYKNA